MPSDDELVKLAVLVITRARDETPGASDEQIEQRAVELMCERVSRAREENREAGVDPLNLEQLDLVSREVTAVRELGERFGYGQVMQLCEQIWKEKEGTRGGELIHLHLTGPCASMMVRCPGPQHQESHPDYPHCDWCCGSHRVTKKVAEAITGPPPEPEPEPNDGPSRYEIMSED